MSEPILTEIWFSQRDSDRLAGLVYECPLYGRIVELGSWEGRSTIVIANAAWPRFVEAVDHWLGHVSDVTLELAQSRDVHATFLHNMDAATQGNVYEYRMDWREHRAYDDHPISLIFIDAAHTYDEVTAQLDAYLPLMMPGGIVCGDDLPINDVHRAVIERFGEVTTCERLWWVKL